jgi:hypothetical protein
MKQYSADSSWWLGQSTNEAKQSSSWKATMTVAKQKIKVNGMNHTQRPMPASWMLELQHLWVVLHRKTKLRMRPVVCEIVL